MDPLFTVGQRVNRKEDREIVGAEVLEVLSIINMNGSEYIYKIKYDEGPSDGNDGTGFWPENSLIAESALLEEPTVLPEEPTVLPEEPTVLPEEPTVLPA